MGDEYDDTSWSDVRKLLWSHHLYLLGALFNEKDNPTYVLRAIFGATFMTFIDINPNDPGNVWFGIKTLPGVVMSLETYEHELRVWHRKNSLVRLGKAGGVISTMHHWLQHKRNHSTILKSKETLGFRTTKLYAALLIFAVLVVGAFALDSLPDYMRKNLFKYGMQFMNFVLGG